MKLRNNLRGRMKYQFFIPMAIEDYHFDVDAFTLQELESLFKKLNDLVSVLPEEERMQLIRMEAKDSWQLSEDVPANPFSCVAFFDNENVENIVRATVYGAEALEVLPISSRMIRNIHYLICEGADYDRKYRGEYRKSPIWIGNADKGLKDATFVPPVEEDMTAAIVNFENYMNYSDDNVFVKAAVIHYQFEMIHPFIDGNGRTGRLLNNLFLTENGILEAPVLLLSHVIARGYNRYCSELQRVHDTGDIIPWLRYWLKTLSESAKYTLQVLKTNI